MAFCVLTYIFGLIHLVIAILAIPTFPWLGYLLPAWCLSSYLVFWLVLNNMNSKYQSRPDFPWSAWWPWRPIKAFQVQLRKFRFSWCVSAGFCVFAYHSLLPPQFTTKCIGVSQSRGWSNGTVCLMMNWQNRKLRMFKHYQCIAVSSSPNRSPRGYPRMEVRRFPVFSSDNYHKRLHHPLVDFASPVLPFDEG